MEGGDRLEGVDAGGRGFLLDRSKLRVLLCDNDAKSSQEILVLLSKCSYQVTTVRTARQVIDILTTQELDIDIILAEVDLPLSKGLKMLKCIARKKELRRIPIIMMSSQDEVSIIVKCLRLGAADYLVKPLRTNELLNLWTHTWRRRRMLGLTEKEMFNLDNELVLSDPSDANTNSTTLLSEDTDDMNRTVHQEVTLLDQREHESIMGPVEKCLTEETNALEDGDLSVFSGLFFSWPKKTDLKVGESSAFLTYVKPSAPTRNSHFSSVDQNIAPRNLPNGEEENLLREGTAEGQGGGSVQEFHSHGISFPSIENTSSGNSIHAPMDFPMAHLSSPSTHSIFRAERQTEVPSMRPIFTVPYYINGQSSPMQGLHGSFYDMHMYNPPSLLPQYNVLFQSHHAPMMQQLAYHPSGINLQSGHTPPMHIVPLLHNSHVKEVKSGPTERRAAVLMKFKRKKKDRCYNKKIRYVNRKRLADKRPRVRGQFVRQINGVDAHNNCSATENNGSEEEEDEETLSRELEIASSPEPDVFKY
ncbi:Two-component response regulator-like PRR1 [Apostasia shenzhenica]|uniref:Two-component response regulator-like PRR1 n=1 Tax=Apostasia shenzhenica TaxID=1088818 RepID=A0A2I0BEK0_9ASPA|nr:Two-component response regulator-like PRR1 [Apostasia shenzhenica]